MDDLQLLIDLHQVQRRQGPGGDAETKLAIQLGRIDASAPWQVADIGCGTGAAAILLANELNARVTAVDLHEPFLTVLRERAAACGVADRVTTLAGSMEQLPFGDEAFDILWSEGAIYHLGFAKGVELWRRFLRPNGLLVVSEITWTTASRPAELEEHWRHIYPEIDVASAKLRILETHGYTPVAYFVLPQSCWLDNYYRPLQDGFAAFLARHGHREAARAIVDAERQEIALYERYQQYFSYGMYLARRTAM